MLDIKAIRNNYEEIEKGVLKRSKGDFGLSKLRTLEVERRKILVEVEQLRNEQKTKSKLIPQYKKEGKDADSLLIELKELSNTISEWDEKLNAVEQEMNQKLYDIPNILQEDVPEGADDSDNVEIRRWGEPRKFDFEPKPHWELGVQRNMIDSERGAKVSGSRFSYLVDQGAKLERALVNFMLDYHTNSGKYMEMNTPVLVNRDAMIGTGQLPKFEEDMFHLDSDKDLFLIPTAEVPLTNYYRGEILQEEDLPIYLTAYTPCFRAEAGSAGRDMKGIIRQHQFDKIELVKLVKPENSEKEHLDLLQDAEDILQALELPYRVVNLCGGDVGFSSSKTYDLEVWLPSFNTYREISSVSNFLDFQARRASLRYRDESGKVQFMHTLNGSGLAVGRTLAAVMENYQKEDGTIEVPTVLRKYLGGVREI